MVARSIELTETPPSQHLYNRFVFNRAAESVTGNIDRRCVNPCCPPLWLNIQVIVVLIAQTYAIYNKNRPILIILATLGMGLVVINIVSRKSLCLLICSPESLHAARSGGGYL